MSEGENSTNYLNIVPSAARICDQARIRERIAIQRMQDHTRSRDQEIAKNPPNTARASQLQADYVIEHHIAALMKKLREEHCGL